MTECIYMCMCAGVETPMCGIVTGGVVLIALQFLTCKCFMFYCLTAFLVAT